MAISPIRTFRLKSLANLQLHNVKAELVTYRSRRAVQWIEHYEQDIEGDPIAVISDSDFKDGVIQAEIVGTPHAYALDFSRGLVGIAFHVQPNGSRFECFFLRPSNGRADDQLRRNHSTQYISYPEYPWDKLRRESPGVYESYADLVPGAWTKVKIVVSGVWAQLYVNGARQPCLIVNDLKLGETRGAIALWVGSGSDAYFSKVVVK